MKTVTGIGIIAICILRAGPAPAAESWPAEANTSAVKLTLVDTDLDDNNMSGACWNPTTRTLWLANNYGRFFALVEDGAGSFQIATNGAGTKAKWLPGGDVEAVCQVEYSDDIVYILDENGWIREYDVSAYGVVSQNRAWDIRAECPEVSGAGPEGITFVPDVWLQRQGFRSADGDLYVSTNGLGGLMLVGHQSGGYVHAFDLKPSDSSYRYVGRFKTGRSETAGLEFDRQSGKLYIWHNTGVNYLEITELNSYPDGADRRLRPLVEYEGPRSGNLEGFACVPTVETNHWCFITDDNNDSDEAIVWYRAFEPDEDTDADELPDGWELRHFGTATQTVGSADSDGDDWNNKSEYIADTAPTSSVSFFPALTIVPSPAGCTLRIDPSSTGRVYRIDCKTNRLDESWQSCTNARGTGGAWTVAISTPEHRAFYRAGVQLP